MSWIRTKSFLVMTMSFSVNTKQAIFTVFFSQELSLFRSVWGKAVVVPRAWNLWLVVSTLDQPFFFSGWKKPHWPRESCPESQKRVEWLMTSGFDLSPGKKDRKRSKNDAGRGGETRKQRRCIVGNIHRAKFLNCAAVSPLLSLWLARFRSHAEPWFFPIPQK